VTHGERATQTHLASTCDRSTDARSPAATSDAATQILSRPHQGTSATQTLTPTPTSDQGTQVLLRLRQSWAFTQTERPATSTRTSWTQVPRVALTDTSIDMPTVLVASTGCQAGAYFNNDVIPPGAPCPRLPWAPFEALLAAYPASTQKISSRTGSCKLSPVVAPSVSGERWPASCPTWWVAVASWPTNSW